MIVKMLNNKMKCYCLRILVNKREQFMNWRVFIINWETLKIELYEKISIFYGEKVVHLADF